jgi:hypothetical protein
VFIAESAVVRFALPSVRKRPVCPRVPSPQNTGPVHSIFMIILYWTILQQRRKTYDGKVKRMLEISEEYPDWRTLQGAFGPVDQTTSEILAEGRREEFEKERRLLEHLSN